jgi:hypothetical protein
MLILPGIPPQLRNALLLVLAWIPSQLQNAPLQAPLFTIKAKLFAKSTFVIGYDTAIRLIMPKYYGGEVEMILELASMRYRGCSFLVAGRVDSDGAFKIMDDVVLPGPLKNLVAAPALSVAVFLCLSLSVFICVCGVCICDCVCICAYTQSLPSVCPVKVLVLLASS